MVEVLKLRYKHLRIKERRLEFMHYIKKRKLLFFTLIFIIIVISSFYYILHRDIGFLDKFQENAFRHVEKLNSFGMRYAGSKSETLTVDYISKYFEQIDIETKIEKFKFQYYDLDNYTVTINGKVTNCEQMLINPYKYNNFSGEGVIYDPASSTSDYLKDKIVVAKNTMNLYQLLKLNTRVILLSENEFENVRKSKGLKIDVSMLGNKCDLTSCNVIGSIYPTHHTDKEIIISAHWDSYKGPGASDNASGIGVLLELANYYSSIKDSLPCIIRFVAFGAEELGMLGSKDYVLNHSDELKQCNLLFNIDEVGGNKDIFIEINGGVSEENDKLNSNLYAMSDYEGKWFLNLPLQTYSNVPVWLTNNIKNSCTELNYKFIPGNGMGSDHQIFAQNGVPSTNICISGDIKTHSPDDTLDKVSLNGLRKSGQIVASIVNKTLKQIDP